MTSFNRIDGLEDPCRRTPVPGLFTSVLTAKTICPLYLDSCSILSSINHMTPPSVLQQMVVSKYTPGTLSRNNVWTSILHPVAATTRSGLSPGRPVRRRAPERYAATAAATTLTGPGA